MQPVAAEQLRPEQYRSYLRVLAQVLLRELGPVAQKIDASDVAQEVLLKAHVGWPQFQGTTQAELAAWLRVILANSVADTVRHFRRQKRDAALEQSYRETLESSAKGLQRLVVQASKTSPSLRALQQERALLLAEALAELSDDQRQAVELHHLTDRTVAEIAEKMNRTKASVAGLLRRGLKGLREGFRERNVE